MLVAFKNDVKIVHDRYMDQLWHPKSLPTWTRDRMSPNSRAMPENKKQEFYDEVQAWQDNLKKLSNEIQDLNKGADCIMHCRNSPGCLVVVKPDSGTAGADLTALTGDRAAARARAAGRPVLSEGRGEMCVVGERLGISMVNFDPSILESSVAK